MLSQNRVPRLFRKPAEVGRSLSPHFYSEASHKIEEGPTLTLVNSCFLKQILTAFRNAVPIPGEKEHPYLYRHKDSKETEKSLLLSRSPILPLACNQFWSFCSAFIFLQESLLSIKPKHNNTVFRSSFLEALVSSKTYTFHAFVCFPPVNLFFLVGATAMNLRQEEKIFLLCHTPQV